MKKLLQHVLMNQRPNGEWVYSQGRVYLFISFVAYLLSLALILWKSLDHTLELNVQIITIVLDGLFALIITFGTYVLSGKVSTIGHDYLITKVGGKAAKQDTAAEKSTKSTEPAYPQPTQEP